MAAARPRSGVSYTPLTPWFGALPVDYDAASWDPDACEEYVNRFVLDMLEGDIPPGAPMATLAEIARTIWPFASDEGDLLDMLRLLCAMFEANAEDDMSCIASTIGVCTIDARIMPCDDNQIVLVSIVHEDTRRDIIRACAAGETPTHAQCTGVRDRYGLVFDLATMPSTTKQPPFVSDDPSSDRNRPVQRLFSEEAQTTIEITGYDPNTHEFGTEHRKVAGKWLTAVACGLPEDQAMNLSGTYGVVMADDGTIAKILHPEPSISVIAEWVIAHSDQPDLADRYRRCAPIDRDLLSIGTLAIGGREHRVIYTSENGILSLMIEIAPDVAVSENGLEVGMDLPETMLTGLVGRPLTEVVAHPLFEGLVITGHDTGSMHPTAFSFKEGR